jgi:hypothetical protein
MKLIRKNPYLIVTENKKQAPEAIHDALEQIGYMMQVEYNDHDEGGGYEVWYINQELSDLYLKRRTEHETATAQHRTNNFIAIWIIVQVVWVVFKYF